jgi:hypothetical protein
MALPKIKTPTYELTVPSSGETLVYRPFLVKEQKILLMALESEDQTEMLRAIKQIIINCTIEEVDVDHLPMFDLEYMFLKLRAKSVGETTELKLGHPAEKNSEGDECKHRTDFSLDLMSVEVFKDEAHDTKIVLDEESGIGIVLKYPTLNLSEKIQDAASKSQIEIITDMVVSCVDVIFDREEVYPAIESTEDEISAFLNDLSQDQFEKITNFFTTMPKLKHDIEWTCASCGKDDKVELEGMANFFG